MRRWTNLVLSALLVLPAAPAPGADPDGRDGECSCRAGSIIAGCAVTGPCPCTCHCRWLIDCNCTCAAQQLHDPPGG